MTLVAELIGESPDIVAIRERIARLVARASDVRRLPPVLIQGETGSGKGLVARALHGAGPRSGGPFIDVNCAAIPETLLEVEMFGFERGAFTDARQAKRGLFQAAHRGTLFLDEIGLLPGGLQAKLLTVLEERTVRRIGATQSEPVDVWIIAATNLDLQAATRTGRFREDLYHRLAVLTLALPPLRERPRDIILLVEHFLARACADYGLPAKTLAPDARAALVAYRWPGNVRELINTMERVALLSEAPVVTSDILGLPDPGPAPVATGVAPERGAPPTLATVVDSAERAHLHEALEATGWNVSRAAARLGISRNTIRYRIDKHGLRPGAPAPPRRARRAAAPSTREEAAPAPPALPVTSAPVGGPPPPMTIRWERRRLAVLQGMLASDRDAGPLDTGRVIESLVDKVRSFGGRVEELGAGGFVALFGLEPVEDAVRRAALAAVAMQRAARVTPGGSPGPGVRIGVDLGSFLLGRLPDASLVDAEDKRTALSAMSALMEGIEPGSVVVSGAAAQFLARGFDLMPLGAGAGRRSAFRLGGLERGEPAGGRRTRFVGRDHELDLLRSRLDAAVRGQGQVVAIAGEAGIGKSRLVVELRRGLSDQPNLWLEGHCLPYATPIPCLPLVELLRGACAIVETDGPEGMRDKLRATLDRAGMDGVLASPYLLGLLAPGEGGEALARLSPEVVKVRTFETLRELSRRLAGSTPLVLVVEDLHWVDRTSEEYLATLVEVVAGARILLVTTHRQGYRPPWMEKSYATQVALQPLSPRESLSLVRDVIGPAEVDQLTVEMIVAKAEGNPFFTEELARAVAEGGSPTPGSAVPDTVEEVLMARIDRLAVEDKRVLQAAAVIGRSLPFLLLQAILDPADEALRERLARLQAAEFLYETRAASELEYTFKHTLTHQVAYASLLPGQRRVLHARIVDALEGWQPEGREELVERLAHHAIGAEAWDKAVDYARRAGLQALVRSAHREAAAWLAQAMAALARLPDRPELLEQAIDVRFELRTALVQLGQFPRVLEILREAERLTERLGDRPRLGRVCAYMTDYCRQVGDYRRGEEAGRRAVAIAEALGDLALQVAANIYLGQVCCDLGEYRLASELFQRNVDALEGDHRRERLGLPYLPAVHSRSWLVLCLAELGEFDRGVALAEEGLELAESAEHPPSVISACAALGRLWLRKGELARATAILERALELIQTWHVRVLLPMVAEALGLARVLAGRVPDGIEMLQNAYQQHEAMRGSAGLAPRATALGQAWLETGRADEARRLGTLAVEVARKHRERAYEAWAHCLLGEVASLDATTVAEAEAELLTGSGLANILGLRPLLARCHLALAGAYAQARRTESAAEQLGCAAALFNELGMPVWVARADAARGFGAPPLH
jgi:DNA-binding NtrC family response regulator/tetratricopeptide (TPR) repeat protein